VDSAQKQVDEAQKQIKMAYNAMNQLTYTVAERNNGNNTNAL